MVNLEYLYLVGCPKVTHQGVWAVISKAEAGLKGLGLEGVSSSFVSRLPSIPSVLHAHPHAPQDVARLSELCTASQALRHLKSITLTIETRSSRTQHSWTQDVASLLSTSPLEFFHISSLGGELKAAGLDDQFCSDIVAAHGERLHRFSVHRLRMSLNAVKDVCARCPRLEQLFVVLDRADLVSSVAAESRRSSELTGPFSTNSDNACRRRSRCAHYT